MYLLGLYYTLNKTELLSTFCYILLNERTTATLWLKYDIFVVYVDILKFNNFNIFYHHNGGDAASCIRQVFLDNIISLITKVNIHYVM